jgi:hypothetical protein
MMEPFCVMHHAKLCLCHESILALEDLRIKRLPIDRGLFEPWETFRHLLPSRDA